MVEPQLPKLMTYLLDPKGTLKLDLTIDQVYATITEMQA
jgi:hypothetical protein